MSQASRQSGPLRAEDGQHPLREVWTIAWPTVLTMTSYTVMQFIDKLMVGQVGPLEVAAQGNGGIWAFTPIAIAMGFLTVVNTYVSQNLGAGTPERGPRYAWNAIWLSLVSWIFVLLPLAFIVPWVFGHMHDPEKVVEVDRLVGMETMYARVLLIGGVLTLCSRSLSHFFFGLHRPKVITVSAIIGNLVNVGLNYVLIFGHEGLRIIVRGEELAALPGIPGIEPLGLLGTALGTVGGTFVEFAIPAAIFLGPKLNKELKTRLAWRPSWPTSRDLFRIGWPAAVQYGNELICWSLFMTVLVGQFGADHMTAGWIALSYMHLSFMPAVGISTAATSLVGKYIGAGKPDIAVHRARLCVKLGLLYMTACAMLFFFARYPLVSMFVGGASMTPEQEASIIAIGAKLMICAAVFQTVDALGIIYAGALRGAGDTVWPGVYTMVYSWVFIVGGGWFMIVKFPEFESIGPWIGAAAYLFVLGLTMMWRFESGRWRRIKLLDHPESDAARVAPIGPAPPSTIPEGTIADIAEEIAEGVAGE